MFSLTRVVGDRLTCSCAFPQAFHPYDVVKNEFCRMLPMKSSKNVEVNHYHINCVSDLDEDGGPIDVSIYFNSKLALSILPYIHGRINLFFVCILPYILGQWKQQLYDN